jgi:hypothetical protein
MKNMINKTVTLTLIDEEYNISYKIITEKEFKGMV